jgi:transposase
MVKQKHITASQELRLKAVHLKQDHQDWSYSKIGKKIGCSHKFVSRWVARHQQGKGVSDQQRSGRPLKADADAQQYIYMAAQLPECSSAADVAAKTQQEKGLKMSPSSITRLLRRKGLQHLTAKVVPMLKDSQKLARVRFAKAALRRELCSWRRVMVTDSKYFRLHAMGRPAGRWCTPATRGTVAKPKHSIAAHVYMGISYHGTTSLKFVTGTHKQVSKYTNPKTKLPHKGVAKDEYTVVLRDHFIPQGNKLFAHAGKWADNWKLQQDNAPPHKTATNMAFIADHVPAGHFLAWPANSPDLSPIENLWAWMDSKLHKLHRCKNVEELKEKLEQVRQSIPSSYLHNVFDGMNARMKRVLDLNGDYIGK